jgi:hypothetical protein
MTTKTVDFGAAHRAQHIVADLLDAQGLAQAGDSAVADAGRLVDEFEVHFEHRDGLRRVVLTGEWEVDPAVVVARQVATVPA